MKPALLAYVRCPMCTGALALEPPEVADTPEILSAALRCGSCGQAYPVIRGIPRLLATTPSRVVRRNVQGFAYEWQRLAQASPKYYQELRSYLGPTPPERLFRNQVVLDAGCGMGKFLPSIASTGAATVIGVDLGESVEAAYPLTRELANVHVVQADLHQLPFGEIFDVICSIGVIHHLPQPQQGLAALVRHLKPEGQLFCWVYGREGNAAFIRWVDPWRRWLCRLPHQVNEAVAKGLAGVLWLVAVGLYRPLAACGVRRLPLQDYLLYFQGLGFRFLWGTVLDKIVPTITWFISREELSQWLEQLGLDILEVSQRHGHSWRALSRKRVGQLASLV